MQAVIGRDLSVSTKGRMLYWAARSCAATAVAEVGTFDKHWGEDRRLTRLARTSVLDWERWGRRGGDGEEGRRRRSNGRERHGGGKEDRVSCLPLPFRPSPL